MKQVAHDRPAVVLVEVVVRPVEVRVPLVLEIIEVGRVRVAIRVLPL